MDQDEPVVIAGRIQWPEELHDEIHRVLVTLTARSRQDEGCLEYQWSSDLEQRGAFWFFEAWASQASFEHHRAADYEHEFMQAHASRAISATARQYAHAEIVELTSESPRPIA
jgi:quinol monooxygenase YgiN